jgi:hypothetical protein
VISLVKPAEANHAAAVSYYKACIDKQVPMHLSTIAASEFAMRQSVLDLELRNFIVLPFKHRSCNEGGTSLERAHARRQRLQGRGQGRSQTNRAVRL